MEYLIALNQLQIDELVKQKLVIEVLDEETRSDSKFVRITIRDSFDILSLFYAGCYYEHHMSTKAKSSATV